MLGDRWICLTCASPWHLDETPPDDAECRYCGGEIDMADPFWRWPKTVLIDGSGEAS